MSKILALRDTITVTIDNTKNPVEVNMASSRELPIPLIIAVFANLIAQLSGQIMSQIRNSPLKSPLAEPSKGSNGA